MELRRILVLAGPDSPGVLHETSSLLFARGCNVEDCRLAVLGGQFCQMMLVSGASDDLVRVEHDLPAFEQRTGLKALWASAGPESAPGGQSVRVEVVAMDAPGILLALTEAIARHAANIEALDAHLAPSPAGSGTISSLKLRLRIPAGEPLAHLQAELQVLAGRMNLSLRFEPLPT